VAAGLRRPGAVYGRDDMDGYDDTTYGDAFADVYDEWYHGVSDVETTVATLTDLIGDAVARDAGSTRRVLELGVGTGRIALPLARAGGEHIEVVGVDTSESMLTRLAGRDPDGLVSAHLADMVSGLPDGPFDLAVVAYNTIFNLTSDGDQQRCFDEVAKRLGPRGRFVVEAFVPDEPPRRGDDISIKSMTADSVVLSISRHDGESQRAEGHFVELTEPGGVRLRPWSIRYATPAQLDRMAAGAGFELENRWHDMGRSLFEPDSDRHVSVYRLM
jgi:ubiquinone/menaquinone biosynthesis C-methylase UbiE